MPETTQSNNARHWVVGAVLLALGSIVAITLVLVNSQAANVTTQTQVNNVLPTVAVPIVSDQNNDLIDDYGGNGGTITLTAGADKTVYVNFVATDLNGETDQDHAEFTAYRTGTAGGYGCTADKNDCYHVSTCTQVVGYGTGTEVFYSCQIDFAFFTDSTSAGGVDPAGTWSGEARVYDEVGYGSHTGTQREMGTLLALNFPSTINYGTLAVNSSTTAANNQQQNIEQYGNDQANVNVSSGSAMSCTTGSIPVANQQFSTTDIDYNAVGTTPLSGTPTNAGITIGYRTNDGTPLNASLYWNIAIPVGVEGSCSGTTVATAVAA